jgi:hypothetical protein
MIPTKRERVMDLVRAAGVDVSDWANYVKGERFAAANPKYCYEWAFVEDGKVVVLNLWLETMREKEGRIVYEFNAREVAYGRVPSSPVWTKRALRVDEAIKKALEDGLEIRVVVCDGEKRHLMDREAGASKVRNRVLDPIAWKVHEYDMATGQCVLVRGVHSHHAVDHLDVGRGAIVSIREVADELNRRCVSHAIGQLQTFRRELRGGRGPIQSLFDHRTISESYAFHVGGRTELQFNIGIESIGGVKHLRHGVAFSLELTQSLPTIEPLLPKIARFNEFLRSYPDVLTSFRMWHFVQKHRSEMQPPAPISPALAQEGVFIYLGTLSSRLDIERILSDFDRLLPLYVFVEGAGDDRPALTRPSGFRFSPGCGTAASFTTATVTERTLDIDLRHNVLKRALHDFFSEQDGAPNVGSENPTGIDFQTRIDVVRRLPTGFWFYEIKTALSARACIREALGQLLEYSIWPGAQQAERLVVVGEPVFDEQARAFLGRLRELFGLPIDYQQFILDDPVSPRGRLIVS